MAGLPGRPRSKRDTASACLEPAFAFEEAPQSGGQGKHQAEGVGVAGAPVQLGHRKDAAMIDGAHAILYSDDADALATAR